MSAACYSFCCWEPVEVFNEWSHQLFLLGHGGTMATRSKVPDGAQKLPWANLEFQKCGGNRELLKSVLVFTHVQVPPAGQVSSYLWPWGGLSQLTPHLGSEVGEEGRPNSHEPCLCANGKLLAMSCVESAPWSNRATALHQALKGDQASSPGDGPNLQPILSFHSQDLGEEGSCSFLEHRALSVLINGQRALGRAEPSTVPWAAPQLHSTSETTDLAGIEEGRDGEGNVETETPKVMERGISVRLAGTWSNLI